MPAGGARKLLRGLYDPDPRVRWAAVHGLGEYAEASWPEAPGSVRETLRRLVWSLNDESGATGWGAPEGIGEIAARIPALRAEFAPLFPSFLSHEDVYLGNPVLDAGALWALGRLGPDTDFSCADPAGLVGPFLEHRDAAVRGAAAWAAGRLGLSALGPRLRPLREDGATLVLLLDGEIAESAVGDLAEAALRGL